MKNYNKPKVVAEIGCNHKGDFEIAKELVQLAKASGADYAKFQKRNPSELLPADQYNAPHPVAYNAYGDTYGAHREFLEFDIKQHQVLKTFAESIGIGYATSVWDMTSAKEVISLNPDFIKIPSACNTNIEMLHYIRDNYEGGIHVSLGMTSKEEEEIITATFQTIGKDRLVLYSCTSGYPVAFKDVCLLEINRLISSHGEQVAAIGFSGHHLGIAIDVAAYTLGAQWIERHFTKDRTWKGTDHAASLESSGLGKLIRNLSAPYESLSYKQKDILDIEVAQRDKLKFQSPTK